MGCGRGTRLVLFAVEGSRHGNGVVENQTLCMPIFACGTKKLWTNSLLQQNNLSANKSPSPAPHPALPGRWQEHEDGQEEKSVEGRMIRGQGGT